jgi:hypothetical protein
VLSYVRFQAVDINALVELYTLHGILFLVATCILLAALMGAIILATVTTERATSVSDIRPYLPAAMLPVLLSGDTVAFPLCNDILSNYVLDLIFSDFPLI